MKKILTLFLLFLGLSTSTWAQDLKGKVVTLTKATELKPDTWYAMYNATAKKFLSDKDNGSLTLNTTPSLWFAEEVKSELVKLVANNGTYYILTATGNYVGELSTNAAKTTKEKTTAFTFTQSGETYSIKAGSLYLSANGNVVNGTGSEAMWTIYTAELKTLDQLSGSQRRTFQDKQLKKEGGVLIRLKNRRSQSSYLSTNEAGKAIGANLKGEKDLSQIWHIIQNKNGYTLRNTKTATFLTGEFAMGLQPADLFIQYSPNTPDQTYVNISGAEDFRGNVCLNLGVDAQSLYKWQYSGDAGSDWLIEFVSGTSIEDIRNEALSASPFVGTVKTGEYYRILNANTNLYMNGGTTINCRKLDETLLSMYWQFEPDGNGYKIKNVLSDKYIQNQYSLSWGYETREQAARLYPTRTNDQWKNTWVITDDFQGSRGLHCDASARVVNWYSNSSSNVWLFEKVDLSAETIAAAKQQQAYFENLKAQLGTIQSHLDNLFADKACTKLKSNIANLSDAELQANADFQALPQPVQEMTLKVKNNSWGLKPTTAGVTDSYEKFFRVTDYKVYSHHQEMSWLENASQSNAYCKLSNPSGIFVDGGKLLYIYVDQDPKSDCSLQAEMVTTDGVPGSHQTGVTTDLHAGLNIIQADEQSVLYIFYQLNDTKKMLANYPDIKIHVEGGEINGVFDITRNMKNQDWENMISLGLLGKCPVINMKTPHLMFAMDSRRVIEAMNEAKRQSGDKIANAELLMNIWNTIVENEESFQGLEHLEGRYRNVWGVFSVGHMYMYASTYGTYYENSTLSTVMNYYNMTNSAGNLWGPSHEIGHNHQLLLNSVGNTEVSNNLYSNINVFQAGVSGTAGMTPLNNFTNLAEGKHFLDRDIWLRTRMYYQLYLFFHQQGYDTRFYQKLHQELRKDPMKKTNQQKTVIENGQEHRGTLVYGKDDYLKFAKKCCDVAKMDLSEFFESYGFFVPATDKVVGDYGTYILNTSKSDIDAAKRYMSKYPRKAAGGALMFITDQAKTHPVLTERKFHTRSYSTDGNRVAYNNEANHQFGREVQTGDYMEFDKRENYTVNSDYYYISGSTITFKGTGFLGHKVYDKSGNLIWACAKNSVTIPMAIRNKFPNEVTVVAVEPNLNDIPCHYFKNGESPIFRTEITFNDGTKKEWWINKNVDQYLPTNAIATLNGNTAAQATEEVLSTRNLISANGTVRNMVIDANKPLVLPRDFTAENLLLTKSGTGYQALTLPFEMKNAQTVENNKLIRKELVAVGQPVIMQDSITIELTNVDLKAGEFKTKENGNIIAADGQSIIAASEALSPFTYSFDTPSSLVTAINAVLSAPDALQQKVYDLNGRRIHSIKQPGLYLINGKKVMLK